MTNQRKIEIFSAGCSICQNTITLVEQLACPSCDIQILDMNDNNVAKRAAELGIKSVPTVMVDGKIASCCEGRGPNETDLREAGIGQPL